MKVKISETVDVSDEQRLAIAKTLHGPKAKKDHATRDELKDYVWKHGRDWAELLSRGLELQEDLIGSPDAEVSTAGVQGEVPGMELI